MSETAMQAERPLVERCSINGAPDANGEFCRVEFRTGDLSTHHVLPVATAQTLAVALIAACPLETHFGSYPSVSRYLQRGDRIRRMSWPDNVWVYYVFGGKYDAQMAAARTHFGNKVPYRAYLAIVTPQGDVEPWVASQSDLLADDWIVLP